MHGDRERPPLIGRTEAWALSERMCLHREGQPAGVSGAQAWGAGVDRGARRSQQRMLSGAAETKMSGVSTGDAQNGVASGMQMA